LGKTRTAAHRADKFLIVAELLSLATAQPIKGEPGLPFISADKFLIVAEPSSLATAH